VSHSCLADDVNIGSNSEKNDVTSGNGVKLVPNDDCGMNLPPTAPGAKPAREATIETEDGKKKKEK
jgi:hypothetical protein